MSWLLSAPLIAATYWWDFAGKACAALAVVVGPTLVVLLTRRGSRADRTTVERTEVEKLYVSGTQDLIKHLQGEITARSTELATARRKMALLQEELDTANKSFAAYQDQYRRLLDLLKLSGITVPAEDNEAQP